MAIFAFWLLLLLPIGQQSEPAAKNDTAKQQTGKANGGVVLTEDKKPTTNNATNTANKKRGAIQTPVPQQGRSERVWVWFKSLNSADWLLVVTTLYLGATVKIWLAMKASNELAKAAQKEGKDAADADRELMGQQLAEMKTTSAGTLDLALAAKGQIDLLAKHVEAAKLAADSAHNSVLVAVAQSNIARLDQRAWVSFMKIECRPFVIGKWIQVGVDVRNTGKTPARGTTKMRVRILPDWEPPELAEAPWLPSGVRSRAMFFPGALSHTSGYARSGNEPIVLTTSLLLQINTGALKIFADGRIDYSDAFGAVHWSEFRCVWHPVECVFTQCEEGNGTDDEWEHR